jgi:hypothetical protein
MAFFLELFEASFTTGLQGLLVIIGKETYMKIIGNK